MAEEDTGQERTETASPRRREEARKRGQIAVSADLNTGVLLLAAALAFWLSGESLGGALLAEVKFDLARTARPDMDAFEVRFLLASIFIRTLQSVGVFLGVVFTAGVVAGFAQGGFAFYPDLLTVKPERIDPTAGVKRLFSLGSVAKMVLSFAKLGIAAVMVYVILNGRLGQIAMLSRTTLGSAVIQSWSIILRLFISLAVALFIIGVIDYIIQRFRLERQLRMTRQEAKEESKQEEGDPQIKARIRRLQREAAQKRMMQNVPKATVVITNPTHLAVALRYERGKMEAPQVIAVGAGFVAERIIEIARRHAVPVVENKPLAQALFRVGKLDQEIPAAFYQAVAEVMAFVFKLRGISA
jgi:flagellar biosynthetic protein FlhB